MKKTLGYILIACLACIFLVVFFYYNHNFLSDGENIIRNGDIQIFTAEEKFSMELPLGLKKRYQHGIDSYAGEFEGDGFKVTFDMGNYSDDLSYLKDKPNYSEEKINIDDNNSILKEAMVSHKNYKFISGVYFSSLSWFAQDATGLIYDYSLPFTVSVYYKGDLQRAEAIEILKSIKIMEPYENGLKRIELQSDSELWY